MTAPPIVGVNWNTLDHYAGITPPSSAPEQQFEILRSEGCMQAQGCLFSKAQPASESPAMLQPIEPRIEAA